MASKFEDFSEEEIQILASSDVLWDDEPLEKIAIDGYLPGFECKGCGRVSTKTASLQEQIESIEHEPWCKYAFWGELGQLALKAVKPLVEKAIPYAEKALGFGKGLVDDAANLADDAAAAGAKAAPSAESAVAPKVTEAVKPPTGATTNVQTAPATPGSTVGPSKVPTKSPSSVKVEPGEQGKLFSDDLTHRPAINEGEVGAPFMPKPIETSGADVLPTGTSKPGTYKTLGGDEVDIPTTPSGKLGPTGEGLKPGTPEYESVQKGLGKEPTVLDEAKDAAEEAAAKTKTPWYKDKVKRVVYPGAAAYVGYETGILPAAAGFLSEHLLPGKKEEEQQPQTQDPFVGPPLPAPTYMPPYHSSVQVDEVLNEDEAEVLAQQGVLEFTPIRTASLSNGDTVYICNGCSVFARTSAISHEDWCKYAGLGDVLKTILPIAGGIAGSILLPGAGTALGTGMGAALAGGVAGDVAGKAVAGLIPGDEKKKEEEKQPQAAPQTDATAPTAAPTIDPEAAFYNARNANIHRHAHVKTLGDWAKIVDELDET